MANSSPSVTLITGTRKGIGRSLAEHYLAQGHQVIGCSRQPSNLDAANYLHVCLDVIDEEAVLDLFATIRKNYGKLDNLVNNAGVASMNHCLLTPLSTVSQIMAINVLGTFLLSRESAKLMRASRSNNGRIVNFSSVARPLNLQGEAVYAASKSAIETLTAVMAKELAPFGITVNAVGPTPVETDLTRAVPNAKLQQLLAMQSIPRYGTYADIANVVDFFLAPASNFVTGQTLYLGGV